jgi:hypothetical protein
MIKEIITEVNNKCIFTLNKGMTIASGEPLALPDAFFHGPS